MTTRLGWLLIFVTLPFLPIFTFYDLPKSRFLAFVTLVFFSASVIFSKFNQFKVAKYLIVIGASSVLVCYSNLLGKESGAYLILFPISSLAFMLFNPKEKKSILFLTTLPMMSYILLEICHYSFIDIHESVSISVLENLHFIGGITAFLLMICSMNIFFSANWKYEWELRKKHRRLVTALRAVKIKKRQDIELDLVKKTANDMIQREWPNNDRIKSDCIYHPSEFASGDYVMGAQISPHEYTFAIVDVAEHGLSACLMMSSIKGIIDNYVSMHKAPKDILYLINNYVCHSSLIKKQAPLIWINIDINRMVLTYSNGGHQEGYIYRDDSYIPLDKGGVVIGVFEDEVYEEETISLHHGDTILLFTDGLNESSNSLNESYGVNRIHHFMMSGMTGSSAKNLFENFKHFQNDLETKDDISIISVKIC